MPDATLIAGLNQQASEQGLTPPRITALSGPWTAGDRLHEFIAQKYHGDMDWLPREAHRRQHPNAMWSQAKSAIVFGLNYGPKHNPLSDLTHKSHGNVSVYARGGDYHDLFKKRLKKVAGWLHRETGQAVKVFVDTAPLMEKPLAAQAGLGWQGKHTNLVSRDFGSWLFLGVILSEAELPTDMAAEDHCGSCQACIDICPTQAFTAPYQLDARACISYLTIEHKGHIDLKYRAAMRNRIYGCDDCLAICPWNKYAKAGNEAKLQARPGASLPELADLTQLNEAGFREVFAGSPIKRTGRDRFLRNVLIAVGNSRNPTLVKPATNLLSDPSALVRAMAIWALSQLLPIEEFTKLAAQYQRQETDPQVAQEWKTGLNPA
ncbi:MAG: tRNA epoxyqueuosine(34) reductase QueG [Robiginitomaculum sp.]|nr:MAG: tRNA epoxyqueuosine(34) reductase QueG [Robiginitomaculum sp.]